MAYSEQERRPRGRSEQRLRKGGSKRKQPFPELDVPHVSLYGSSELKAEIEKLKAAQRNNRNIDPERYRLCRQEITSLRMKLHQQERDMAELQR